MSEDLNRRRWEAYLYPGTDVLINKVGLRDQDALATFEYRATALAEATMPQSVRDGNLDLAHLQAIHKHLFADVYSWAGTVRDVYLSKGTTNFERPEGIEAAAAAMQRWLVVRDHLRGLDKSSFTEQLCSYHKALNQLHPFREGNGRSARVLIDVLAERAGYTLDNERIQGDKGRWVSACIANQRGDSSELRQVFAEAIRPSRAVAFEAMSRSDALAKHPDLQPVYAALDDAAARLAVEHPGNARAQAHFMEHKRSELVRKLDTGDARVLSNMQPPPKPAGRFDEAWQKAKAYAETSIQSPRAREQFLSQFWGRIQAEERGIAKQHARNVDQGPTR